MGPGYNKSEYCIAIVLDPGYGKRLTSLSKRIHTWAVESPENRAVAKEVSQFLQSINTTDWLSCGVTLFNDNPEATPEKNFTAILPVVDEHHGEYSHDPPWTKIEVYGVRLTEDLKIVLSEYGVTAFNTVEGGFVCCRKTDICK